MENKYLDNNLGTIETWLDVLDSNVTLKIKAERGSDSTLYIDFGQFRGYFSVELPELNDYDDIPVSYVNDYMLDCLIKSVDYVEDNKVYVSLFYDDITKLGYEIYDEYMG